MSEKLQYENTIKSLNAQLEATKGMLNESLMNQLNLRSSLVMIQSGNTELLSENNTLKADKEKLIVELDALKATTAKPVFDPAALESKESKVSPLPSPIKAESKDAVNKIC